MGFLKNINYFLKKCLYNILFRLKKIRKVHRYPSTPLSMVIMGKIPIKNTWWKNIQGRNNQRNVARKKKDHKRNTWGNNIPWNMLNYFEFILINSWVVLSLWQFIRHVYICTFIIIYFCMFYCPINIITFRF